jgi:hypothetical protein
MLQAIAVLLFDMCKHPQHLPLGRVHAKAVRPRCAAFKSTYVCRPSTNAPAAPIQQTQFLPRSHRLPRATWAVNLCTPSLENRGVYVLVGIW